MTIEQKGFGLIELMIAIAIIGILAAVAYPAYQGHLKGGYRGEAIILLQAIATEMEEYAVTNGGYAGALLNGSDASVFKLDTDKNSSVGVYDFAFSSGPSAASYAVTATPIAGKAMDGDGKMIIYWDGRSGWDKDNDDTYAYALKP